MEGYVNIDFPLSEHTIQEKSVADEFHNLYELTYKPGTISEVRLHHVFEHFERMAACAFMAGWNSWLKPGGILHIARCRYRCCTVMPGSNKIPYQLRAALYACGKS